MGFVILGPVTGHVISDLSRDQAAVFWQVSK